MFEKIQAHWLAKIKNPENNLRADFKELAATYSRRTYRTTTIGKAMFDGRVRNGNGSDHSFMATKFIVTDFDRNFLKDRAGNRQFSENYTQESLGQPTIRELKFAIH